MDIKNNVKKLFGDSVLSIIGIVFMNAVAQFAIYPFWERTFGTERYGTIVYLLSMMNIAALTFGPAANYTRIMISARHETRNAPYTLLMFLYGGVTAVYALIVAVLDKSALTPLDTAGYVVLSVLTSWRAYADVEYRIHLNYKGFCLYYVLIGAGYGLGVFIMPHAGTFTAALIPGEIIGLLYVLLFGHIFKPDSFTRSDVPEIAEMFGVLAGSYFINTLIFNADRILLNLTVGSAALSVYYIASLFGKTLSLVTTPLNGVISGYLARMEKAPERKYRILIIFAAAVLFVLAALACTAGAYIVLPFLYGETFELAKGSVFVCSIAQTVYFATNILSVVMLRFAPKKHQMAANVVYAGFFAAVCIPLTMTLGMKGFYTGMILTSASRFVYDSVIIMIIKDGDDRNGSEGIA